jgi:hypothetical protein
MGVSNAAPWSSWIQAQDANNNATNYPLLLNPNGGNIGIGEDNPQNSLHISGSSPAIRFGDTGSNGSAFSIIEDNDGLFKIRNDAGNSGTGSGIAFEVDAAERLRIDSAGRLLIGRTTALASSAERLTIDDGMAMFRRSSTNAAAVYIRNEDSTADTRQPYLIFTDGSGNRGGFGVQYNESSLWISGQNGIAFRTGGTAPSTTERLRITSAGQMGLGTNDPNSYGSSVKLAVANTSGTCGLSIVSATNGDGNLYYADGTSGDATYRGYIRYNHTIDQFRIGVAGGERVRIDSAGRLMLGTTTEGFATYGDKLTIADSGHCGMTIRSGTSSYGTIYFSDGADGSADEVRGFIDYNHSNNQLQIGTDGATRLRITSDGKVGLKNTPSENLHIDGAFKQDGHSNEVQCTQMCFTLPSGSTSTMFTLSSYGNDATAMAVLEYVALYSYASNNHCAGIEYASTRRSSNNTAWTDTDNQSIAVSGNDTSIAPNIYWENGVLKISTGGSVQITGTLRLTTRRFGVTRNFNAG